MSKDKYAVISNSKVYHNYEGFRTTCGVFACREELRKSRPKGKRLCKRCAMANYKFSTIKGSKVYHILENIKCMSTQYLWISFKDYRISRCGQIFPHEDLLFFRPRGKRLCRRCQYTQAKKGAK